MAAKVSGLREVFATVRQTNTAHVSALDALERTFVPKMTLFAWFCQYDNCPHAALATVRQTNSAHVSALDALDGAFAAETAVRLRQSTKPQKKAPIASRRAAQNDSSLNVTHTKRRV